MEVFCNVHIVKTDQRIEIFLLDLNVSQLTDFHHQLHLLLVSQGLVDQDVLDIVSLLRMDLEVLVFVDIFLPLVN